MKKIFLLLLTVFTTLSLSGCSTDSDTLEDLFTKIDHSTGNYTMEKTTKTTSSGSITNKLEEETYLFKIFGSYIYINDEDGERYYDLGSSTKYVYEVNSAGNCTRKVTFETSNTLWKEFHAPCSELDYAASDFNASLFNFKITKDDLSASVAAWFALQYSSYEFEVTASIVFGKLTVNTEMVGTTTLGNKRTL